jgi:hypothetical protein
MRNKMRCPRLGIRLSRVRRRSLRPAVVVAQDAAVLLLDVVDVAVLRPVGTIQTIWEGRQQLQQARLAL